MEMHTIGAGGQTMETVPSKNEPNLRCRIDHDLNEAAKAQAKKEKRTMTALVELALEQYLARAKAAESPQGEG